MRPPHVLLALVALSAGCGQHVNAVTQPTTANANAENSHATSTGGSITVGNEGPHTQVNPTVAVALPGASASAGGSAASSDAGTPHKTAADTLTPR